MIKEKQPLSLCELGEMLKGIKQTDKTKDMGSFIKKFCKIKPEKAKKLREELEKLELIKLKNSDIAKIIDLLPDDAAELNKIFTDITLDADETNKILETVKQNL